jgi:hypothetical protein
MTDTSAQLEVLPPSGQRAVVWWKDNPMLPSSFRRQDGTVDMVTLERACRICIQLEMDPVETVRDMFVVKDQIGFKADLQRHLLMRVPGYDFEILEIDDEHVTARVMAKGVWKTPITKRITDKDMVVYAKNNKANYEDKGRRMLEARVTTESVDLYAKGVLRGWLMPMGIELADGYGEDGVGPGNTVTREVRQPDPAPIEQAPRSTAPDGSTIPEPLREPEVSDDMRVALLDRVKGLNDDQRAALNGVWFQEFHAPNPNTHRFTVAHAALLWRLLDELAPRTVDTDTGEVEPPVPPYKPEEEEPF